jgi:hypothetical protein
MIHGSSMVPSPVQWLAADWVRNVTQLTQYGIIYVVVMIPPSELETSGDTGNIPRELWRFLLSRGNPWVFRSTPRDTVDGRMLNKTP